MQINQIHEDIKKVLNKLSMKSNLNSMLTNGNNFSVIIQRKNKYTVNNTYAFDSLDAIISIAYVDNPKYKIFIDSNNHIFIRH